MRVRELNAIYGAVGGAVLGAGVALVALHIFGQRLDHPVWLPVGAVAGTAVCGWASWRKRVKRLHV